jgi:bacillithiol biosynthesis deacetylase BshB1
MVGACDILAVGAHPDDVELGCGGTLARAAARGHRVGVVDLTAGEMATRGSAELRRQEAEEAGRALGVAWRHCLALPDGGLRGAVEEQVAALVAALRAAQPRAVLLHDRGDPHPDHGGAAKLTQRAAFLSGVGRFASEGGPPWRPSVLLAFPGPRQLLEPSLVVDVTAHYGAKRRALAAHASQFGEGVEGAEAATHLSSGYFLAAVEGRDRATGNLIGREFGEGLVAVLPPSADDLAWLFGGLP